MGAGVPRRSGGFILIRYALRLGLAVAMWLGAALLLLLFGIALAGLCTGAEVRDGAGSCFDHLWGWEWVVRLGSTGVALLTWFGTRFITHGLWKPPAPDPEKASIRGGEPNK